MPQSREDILAPAFRRGTVDEIVNHGLYEIATGRWPAGTRLPSIRDAERRWGVNRLTVLRAYRRLAELGLVASETRSGFRVRGGGDHSRLTRHRHELERLYDMLAEKTRRESGFSVLGAFRYLARLAEIRAREHPEHAFVECTAIQAEGHAAEIAAALHVPVVPLTIDAIAGRRTRLPAAVRTLLTSHWHHAELAPLADPSRLTVVSVPIEVSDDLRTFLAGVDTALILDTSEGDLMHLARDIRELVTGTQITGEVVPDVASALEARIGGRRTDRRARKAEPAILLSPRFWGTVGTRLRTPSRVLPITFRIADSAWPLVADALGLPLGEIGDGRRRLAAS